MSTSQPVKDLTLTPNVFDGKGEPYKLHDPGKKRVIAKDGLDLPPPQLEETFADGPDTRGGLRMKSKEGNSTGRVAVLIMADDYETFWERVREWETAVEAARRRPGAELAFTPEHGERVTYDLQSTKITAIPVPAPYIVNRVAVCEFEFTCLPFARLDEQDALLSDTDTFDYDTVGAGEWRSDGGDSTVAASAGQLVLSDASEKRLYRPIIAEDGVGRVHLFTGDTASGEVDIVLKRLSSTGELRGRLDLAAGELQLVAYSGSDDVLDSAPLPGELDEGTEYWLTGGVEGDTATVELRTSATGLPVASLVHDFSATSAVPQVLHATGDTLFLPAGVTEVQRIEVPFTAVVPGPGEEVVVSFSFAGDGTGVVSAELTYTDPEVTTIIDSLIVDLETGTVSALSGSPTVDSDGDWLTGGPPAPPDELTIEVDGGVLYNGWDVTVLIDVQWGVGVKGNPGLRLEVAADWLVREWRFDAPWVESSEPEIDLLVRDVPGSADALGEVTVVDVEGRDRRHAEFGVDDTYRDEGTKTPVLIGPKSLQPVSTEGYATRDGAYDPTGGTTNNVVRARLSQTRSAVCSTGVMAHTGPRKVKARVFVEGDGRAYARLVYRIGTGAWSRGPDWVQLPATGAFYELDLGTVHVDEELIEGSGWEVRVEGYSESGDDIMDVNLVKVLPARRWGRAKSSDDVGVASYLLSEHFNQTTGEDLNGIDVGGSSVQGVTNYPASVSNGPSSGSSRPWANPAYGATQDGNYAQVGLDGFNDSADYSYLLQATGFDFAIPTDSEIVGVHVEAVMSASIFSAGGGSLENPLNYIQTGAMLVDGGTPVSGTFTWTGDGALQTYDQVIDFGYPRYLWGWGGLTPTVVNDPGFGVGITVQQAHDGPWENTAWVDMIRITVYYKDPTGDVWAVADYTGADGTGRFFLDNGFLRTDSVGDADAKSGYVALPTGVADGVLLTDVGVGVTVWKNDEIRQADEGFRGGVFSRGTGSGYVEAVFDQEYSPEPGGFSRIAVIAHDTITQTDNELQHVEFNGSIWGQRLWFVIDAEGNYWVWTGTTVPELVIAGQSDLLGPSGPFNDGWSGIYDAKFGDNAATRWYDDFEVWVPEPPSPVIPSFSGIRFGHDSAVSLQGAVPEYDGGRVGFTPAGREGSVNQLAVGARRNDVSILPDTGLQDATRVAARLIPRAVLL